MLVQPVWFGSLKKWLPVAILPRDVGLTWGFLHPMLESRRSTLQYIEITHCFFRKQLQILMKKKKRQYIFLRASEVGCDWTKPSIFNNTVPFLSRAGEKVLASFLLSPAYALLSEFKSVNCQ